MTGIHPFANELLNIKYVFSNQCCDKSREEMCEKDFILL